MISNADGPPHPSTETAEARAPEVRPRLARGARGALVGLLLAACATAPVPAEESDRIAELLAIEPGMTVADVGAGSGAFAIDLAQRVGPEGHVWATEVDPEEIEKIEAAVAEADLDNVTVVLGDAIDTGLPEGCCDAILLRLVYHHFTDPAPMRSSLRGALKPGGLLAVIDIVPQAGWRELPEVPDRGGHGLPTEALEAELTADGFEVVARHDDWNDDPDRYCVVFRPVEDG